MKKRWTKKEEKFLRKFYYRTDNHVIAGALNRSYWAISHKGSRLNLKKASTMKRDCIQLTDRFRQRWGSDGNTVTGRFYDN